MDDETTDRPFQFEHPQQEQIYRRLKLIGAGPAAFYRDALRLMANQPPLESTSHLVSHLFREIESALRAALEPISQSQEQKAARKRTGKQGRESKSGDDHKLDILAVLSGLEIPTSDPLSQFWLSLAGRDNEEALHKRAHRASLGPPRPLNEEFRRFAAEFEIVLGAILSRMETRFASVYSRIDSVLALPGAPAAKLARLKNALPNNPIILGYLLGKVAALNDSTWLVPLEEDGYFRHPPPSERSRNAIDGSESIRFPNWPPSQFLARMAQVHKESQVAEAIARIALEISETDNLSVNEDLLVVAHNLPPGLGAQFAPRLGRAVTTPTAGFFPEHVAEFIDSLFEGGEAEAAFSLARQLLQLHPEEVAPLDLGDEVHQFPPSVHGFFDDWMYERVLEVLAPPMVAADEEEAISFLCDLLDDAIAIAKREGDPGPPIDRSMYWWPILDESDEGARVVVGIRAVLILALRRVLHARAEVDPPTNIPRLLDLMSRRSWSIYRRLELDLLRSFAEEVPNQVEARLTDHDFRMIESPLPEYQTLASERFKLLSPLAQRTILDAIEQGPGTLEIEEAFRRSGHEPSIEDVARASRRLAWESLGAIRDSLPDLEQARFADLLEEFGQPKRISRARSTPSAVFVGPTSPLSNDALVEMEEEELIAFLSSWNPPEGYGVLTPEGLGRAITAAAQQSPTRFSQAARSFEDLDPTYVRGMIAGLRVSVRKGAIIDWDATLDLCLWAVKQPREIAGRDQSSDQADPSWGWTRKEIAWLLVDGLSQVSREVPFSLRRQIWSILNFLRSDPDPTPEDEVRYGGSDSNPLDFGPNTVRASAIEATIRYAIWVKRHVSHEASNGGSWKGFATTPEVAEGLEAHLDPTDEPSTAVRSVYGRFLGEFVLLDASWLASHRPSFFPTDADQSLLRDAAWESYVIVHTAQPHLFNLLHDEYLSAVLRLGEHSTTWSWRKNWSPTRKLGEHIVSAFVYGWIDLEEEGGLLRQYFELASAEDRAELMDSIGRGLEQSQLGNNSTSRARLICLWEYRIATAEASDDVAPYLGELSEFGWWFISGRFDDDWSVGQLQRVLLLGSMPTFLFRVINRLAALAEQMPRETVECLNLLLDCKDVGERQLSPALDEIRTVLNAGMTVEDEIAKEIAANVTNRLVSMGFINFRELLAEKNRDKNVPPGNAG